MHAVSMVENEKSTGDSQLPLLAGGCQCADVRFEVRGEALLVAMCHCTMCRRAHAAPVVAWAMFRDDQVRFLATRPTTYSSSPAVRRGFCGRCGTQLCFTADFMPGLIDLSVGSFDRPEKLSPALHYWDSKRLPWMHFADSLPRFSQLPPFEGAAS